MAKFNLERAIKNSAPKRVKAGFHALVATNAERFEKEGLEALKAKITIQVLEDIDDPNSLVNGTETNVWLEFPLPNPEIEGHIESEYSASRFVSWCAALYSDECPYFPHKKSRGRAEPYYFDGEEIDSDDYQDCKNTALMKMGAKAEELWGDAGEGVGDMVGRPFYAKISYRPGSSFANVVPFSELPNDAELIDPEDALESTVTTITQETTTQATA